MPTATDLLLPDAILKDIINHEKQIVAVRAKSSAYLTLAQDIGPLLNVVEINVSNWYLSMTVKTENILDETMQVIAACRRWGYTMGTAYGDPVIDHSDHRSITFQHPGLEEFIIRIYPIDKDHCYFIPQKYEKSHSPKAITFRAICPD